MIRLGVATRILGKAGLRARDGRRAEHGAHLSMSLLLVREVLLYLAERQVACYRLADDLIPHSHESNQSAYARQLEEFGVGYARQRWVEDGKFITAAGVTAGIDMSLHLVAKLTSRSRARSAQLIIEYDPQPPFGGIDWDRVDREAIETGAADRALLPEYITTPTTTGATETMSAKELV